MTPEKERSSRTVCVKRGGVGFGVVRTRGRKSVTAMRGLSTPEAGAYFEPVFERAAGRDKRESVRTERMSEARVLVGQQLPSREFLAERR